jgi:catechol 2,3-dioxygenase-like lactoylglutathione lyase family enzyme
MTIGPAIPALPVADTAAATRCYTDRLGFSVVHAAAGFAIVRRGDCELHLWEADDAQWRSRSDFLERPVRSGGEDFLAGTASCRIEVTGNGALAALFTEMKQSGVVHPTSGDGISDTDYGMQELHVLDLDGNLLSFFTRTGGAP